MSEMPMPPAEPKKSNTGIYIAVAAVVLLCCCCITAAVLWQYGDQIMSALNVQ